MGHWTSTGVEPRGYDDDYYHKERANKLKNTNISQTFNYKLQNLCVKHFLKKSLNAAMLATNTFDQAFEEENIHWSLIETADMLVYKVSISVSTFL